MTKHIKTKPKQNQAANILEFHQAYSLQVSSKEVPLYEQLAPTTPVLMKQVF